jgi:hypothetical protein
MTMDGNDLSRRRYLRIAGATALSAVSGCAGISGSDEDDDDQDRNRSATQTPIRDRRSVIEKPEDVAVNVADVGADPTGEEPVDAVVEREVEDGVHLHFPPGEYRLGKWRILDHENVTITGEDATLVPPDGMQGYWLVWNNLQDFRFEGFTLDCRGRDVAPVNRLVVNGGRNVVRDVALLGQRSPPQSRNGFEMAVTETNGELRLENVRLPDGTIRGSGMYFFPESVGRLIVKDCHIEHWGEGLYASPHSGPIEVIGGEFANNGIAQVRLGGGRNGSLVRDVTVRIDNPRNSEFKQNMRGIWLKEGTNARIENCSVRMTDLTGTYSSGGIVVGRQFGTAEILNTEVLTDLPTATPGIIARRPVDSIEGQSMPSMDRLPERWDVTCRGVHARGSADDGTAIQTTGREECQYEQVCVQHTEGSRDGLSFNDADSCTVRNSVINVGGIPIVTRNALVLTEQVRRNQPCQNAGTPTETSSRTVSGRYNESTDT